MSQYLTLHPGDAIWTLNLPRYFLMVTISGGSLWSDCEHWGQPTRSHPL